MNNLLLRRRALMGMLGEEESLLPYGYTQLKYIVTRQNNGFVPTSIALPHELEIKFAPDLSAESSYYKTLYGGDRSMQVAYNNNGKAEVGNASSGDVFFYQDTPAIINVLLTSVVGDSYYYINGVDTGLKRAVAANATNFILNNGSNRPYGKIYYIIFRKDGNVVQQYVPCKNEQNVLGLYEIYNGIFYSGKIGFDEE